MPEGTTSAAPPRRYAVFLSYRHADNKEPGRQWATWLHQMLESYEVPPDLVGTTNSRGEPIPASLYPVFRDEEELPADADLTQNIRRALENSALLVVLCSPRAVASRFVAEEIRYFKELGKADRILALMIDGEPNASDDPAKLASGLGAALECLPEPLRFGVVRGDGTIDWTARTEPIAADVRPDGKPVQGWTSSAAYRDDLEREGRLVDSARDRAVREYEQRLRLATLKIIAGALAVPLGTLTQRDKAAQLEKARQRARTFRRWLAAVSVLAIAAMIAGSVAYLQRNRAQAAEQATAEQSERQRLLLEEAARSDRLVAAEKLERGDESEAFAHYARAVRYAPHSPVNAATALPLILGTMLRHSTSAFEGHTDSVTSAVFSPDGDRVLTASDDKTARLWEADSGKELARFESRTDSVTSAVFSPDGHRVLTASDDNTVRVWEADSGKELVRFEGHTDSVTSAVFSLDGHRLLTASDDKTARLWEAHSGKELARFEDYTDVTSAVFSPDGRRALTVSFDNSVKLWDGDTAQGLAFFEGHTDDVTCATFSPDGRRVLTASRDQTARLWEADSGKELVRFEGHTDAVRTATFSPDGRRVLTASWDQTARLWEVDSGKLLSTFQDHNLSVRSAVFAFVLSVVFSPDGRRVLTASDDKTARLWEADSGKELARFESRKSSVTSAVFSPDGHRVLTACGDKTARLWEADSGREFARFEGHTDDVTCAVLSPDGHRVLTASLDNTALWPIPKAEEAPPEWFGDFLAWLGGVRIGEDGSFAALADAERLALEGRLRAHANANTDYARILRWRLSPPAERPTDPYGTSTQAQWSAQIVEQGGSQAVIEHAYALDPRNPLIHLLLASFEEDTTAADFLRRYSLDRLPDDPALQLRAAEILRDQKQPAWALGYVERALFHHPDDAKAKALRDALRAEVGLKSPEQPASPPRKTP